MTREPTIYEYAGGGTAWRALAEAHYRRCLTDPVLIGVFGTEGKPDHAEHLAAWLGEVFGGPATYTERYGGHEGMVSHHLGRLITEEQRVRFVDALLEAASEAGMPSDARFRDALRAYGDWGSRIALEYSQPGMAPPKGEPPPRWGWDGLIR
jgi:hemoglobin